jgi:hypothetical protein
MILYAVVVVTVLLALLFHSRYGVRVVCVAVLALLGFLHWSYLMTLHRLVLERGMQHFGASSTKPLPNDFQVAVGVVQELSQGEMTLVFLLIVAFAALALLPFGRNVRRKDER